MSDIVGILTRDDDGNNIELFGVQSLKQQLVN